VHFLFQKEICNEKFMHVEGSISILQQGETIFWLRYVSAKIKMRLEKIPTKHYTL
jgi:hypothetical protein